MSFVAFDTETELFRPACMAPKLVCISCQIAGEEPELLHVNEDTTQQTLTYWLQSQDTLVGHHVAYDMAVICAEYPDLVPLVFEKYDRDQVECTKVRQQLLDIACGEFRGGLKSFSKVDKVTGETVTGTRWVPYEYTLDACTYRAAGRRLEKDEWRLRYGEFLHVPLEEWPEGARVYPKEDARATLDVHTAQEVHVRYIPDQHRQARYAWARHLVSVWGLRTHGPGVDRLEEQTRESLRQIEQGLKDAGLVREDGTRDTKRAQGRMVAVCIEQGLAIRMTDGGSPSLDSDACKATGDEVLKDYAALTSLKSVLAKDIPILRSGITHPVHTSFGMAESGRATSAKPNVMNFRRLPGIREAFVPREGYVFAVGDYAALELHTLAEVCIALFGESRLAEALNAGRDPHTEFAASILGISYEDALGRLEDAEVDNARQTAKVANFGFPGGLGIEKLCLFARKTYGVLLTEQRARELKAAWIEQWPEMQKFFRHCGDLIEGDRGLGTLTQLYSERIRGGCHYTSLCNSFFQGLGADAAQRGLYLVVRACYAEKDSPLYGSRAVNFVHDEIVLEVLDDPSAHDKAVELGRLMRLGADEFLPHVHTKVKPLLARCTSKKAKAIYDTQGRLTPWEYAN